MGTSAPDIRTHDIPITEPYKPPLCLPAPDPNTFAPDYSPLPERITVPLPLRRQDEQQ